MSQRAVKFFLGQDELEEDEEADEGEGGLDVQAPSKQEVYKATAKVWLCSEALWHESDDNKNRS